MLRDLTIREHQAFVMAVGQSVGRRRTVQNVDGTLTSVLNRGRKWGYFIPEVRKQDIEFPTDQTPKSEAFFFDADTASRIINVSPYPFKLMFLIAATCGLRIGEVTALKRSSLDFKRKLIHITAALDYAIRKETTPKSGNRANPLNMTALLERHLRNWVEKHFQPNPGGYLFLNSKGRPYPSDNVVKYGVHRAIAKLGIQTKKGIHVGIHCFPHGVTTELLESGTPIHIVTRLMRHSDSKVTSLCTRRRCRGAYGLRAAVAEDRAPSGAKFRIGASFQRLSLLKQRRWRKRVRVELTTRLAKSRIAGFEGREGHRTLFASAVRIA